ncbi:MAG: hypothetical protein JO306_08740 [Gemmatimonadetes bacterium]|nr:hypothetical protein [Gemmatimonadota bacterium]
MSEARESQDLEREARTWSREDLLRFWGRIKRRENIDGWPPGRAFEYLIIRAFDLEHAPVRWPYQVTYPQRFGIVEQIDGVVYLGDRAFLVESKDVTEPMAVEAVARLRFRLEARPPGVLGVLFSVGGFTFPAEVFAQFASPLNVLLWSSDDLDYALANGSMLAGLRKKLEHATEEGMPLLRLSGVR